MQFQSHYNRFLLSLEGTKNIYVSFCENIISFCAPRTFRFADYTNGNDGEGRNGESGKGNTTIEILPPKRYNMLIYHINYTISGVISCFLRIFATDRV